MKGTVSKIVLFVINLVFFFAGMGIMIFGIIALADPQLIVESFSFIPNYTELTYIIDVQQAILNNAILLTVFGSVIFVMCFLGLCGGCRDGTFMISVYLALVILTLLFQLAALIYMAVDYAGMQNRMQSLMYSSLVKNFEPVTVDSSGNINNGSNAAWSTYQFEHACCGVYDYKDYQKFSDVWNPDKTYPGIVPPSCCMQKVQYQLPTSANQLADYNTCINVQENGEPQYINIQGCSYNLMQDFKESSYNIPAIILISLVALEVIVALLTMHLVEINYRNSKTNSGYA